MKIRQQQQQQQLSNSKLGTDRLSTKLFSSLATTQTSFILMYLLVLIK
jgi:hypothetical protein